jgi:hypothetical protein
LGPVIFTWPSVSSMVTLDGTGMGLLPIRDTSTPYHT